MTSEWLKRRLLPWALTEQQFAARLIEQRRKLCESKEAQDILSISLPDELKVCIDTYPTN